MILSIFATIGVILFTLDFALKEHIEEQYKEGEEDNSVIPGIVVRKVYNKGFMLNFLQKRVDVVKQVTIGSSIGMLLYDIWLSLKPKRRIQKLGMIFASAGMLSNGYDRLVRGKVIDYIGSKNEVLPGKKITFNLADTYLVIGLLVYLASKVPVIKKILSIL